MKNLASLLILLYSLIGLAQENSFFATMSLIDAKELQDELPDEISILAAHGLEAAVYLTPQAAHVLHKRVLVHGPGYIFKPNHEEAVRAIQKVPTLKQRTVDYTITEDAVVAQVLEVINPLHIENHIIELENYNTRYHNRAAATQAAIDLKERWETMAATYGRTDVSVRLYNHVNTNMPSVILTIQGSEFPDEFVIVGGHLDSTASDRDNAPGADDDASGIATITEATRALFEIEFVPRRTIEVMAYAAEEIGLVGSTEIAQEYANNGVDVQAVAQFDMTNFNGSALDVAFITDFTDPTLTNYMMGLLDHYNASGDHAITYSSSLCNYGCSDHASWTNAGYSASFPFEASFGQHNQNIHTSNDTFSISGTANHATKFAKLCAEFLIETAKSQEVLGVPIEVVNAVFLNIENNKLHFDLREATIDFNSIRLVSVVGKEVLSVPLTAKKGQLSLESLTQGVYIATLTSEKGETISKKLIQK